MRFVKILFTKTTVDVVYFVVFRFLVDIDSFITEKFCHYVHQLLQFSQLVFLFLSINAGERSSANESYTLLCQNFVLVPKLINMLNNNYIGDRATSSCRLRSAPSLDSLMKILCIPFIFVLNVVNKSILCKFFYTTYKTADSDAFF